MGRNYDVGINTEDVGLAWIRRCLIPNSGFITIPLSTVAREDFERFLTIRRKDFWWIIHVPLLIYFLACLTDDVYHDINTLEAFMNHLDVTNGFKLLGKTLNVALNLMQVVMVLRGLFQ